MKRIILHCDCNNFFASCEALERPELKNVPMAVAGDPQQRTGVVVAKNELAKRAGVKTTDTVWAAKKKCPGIVFVPPRHALYQKISGKINEIYHTYTEYVEPASIDESYLDLSGTLFYYGMTERELADEIRRRIRDEIGVTISVGVSYNKIFAKMGSDYKKPDATTVITEENYREILWPLPVSELIFAGKSAVGILKGRYIETIGDLARCSRQEMTDLLGKQGEMLWVYANGLDDAPVRRYGDQEEVKSISRGKTFRRDLISEEEIRCGIAPLVDDVAMQLRRQGFKGYVVQVQVKTPELHSMSRQTTLNHATCLQHEIMEVAMDLMKNHWRIGPAAPIRALTVGVTHLVRGEDDIQQLSLFDMMEGAPAVDRERQEKLEAAVDLLRQKHGNAKITLGFRKNEDIGV